MKNPNIILIMTDQQRFDSISAYNNSEISTPNIDRLAHSGVIFDKAYAECPECVPARHALISGRDASRTGVLSNAPLNNLDPKTPTIMSILRKNGYDTHAVGKMHFVPTREHFGFHSMALSEEVPSSIDEDEYFQFLDKDGYLDYIKEPHGLRGQMYYIPQASALPKEKHTTHWTADESIRFLNQHKDKDDPFFMFTSFIKPHPPFDPPFPYYDNYLPNDFNEPIKGSMDTVDYFNHFQITQNLYKCNITDPYFLKTLRSYYHSCVSFVDDMVGRILDTLEKNGQRENTIILFVSDHGDFLGDHACFGKRSWYEGPGRIPIIVSYPKILPQNVRYKHLAGHLDIMPTLLSLASVKHNEIMDGFDLKDAMINNTPVRDSIYGILDFVGAGSGSLHALITKEWKYTYCSNDAVEQLIHISEDPDEIYQLGKDPKYEEIRNKMKIELFEHYDSLGVSDRYFESKTWKKVKTEREAIIKNLYLNPHNKDNTGRYFCASAWDKRSANVQKRAKSSFGLF